MFTYFAKGFGAQELCESRGGRPGLPVRNSLYGLCGRKVTFIWGILPVRSLCLPPVNTVRHSGQIMVHSISQRGTTWWSDRHAFHQAILCHTVVRSSCIPPVNTIPRGGQIVMHSTSQHSTTWWSDRKPVKKGNV